MSNINVLYRVRNITDDKILTVKNNCMKIQDNRPRSYSEKPKYSATSIKPNKPIVVFIINRPVFTPAVVKSP